MFSGLASFVKDKKPATAAATTSASKIVTEEQSAGDGSAAVGGRKTSRSGGIDQDDSQRSNAKQARLEEATPLVTTKLTAAGESSSKVEEAPVTVAAGGAYVSNLDKLSLIPRWTDTDAALLQTLSDKIDAERRWQEAQQGASKEGTHSTPTSSPAKKVDGKTSVEATTHASEASGSVTTMEAYCLLWVDFMVLHQKKRLATLLDRERTEQSDVLSSTHPQHKQLVEFNRDVTGLQPLREDLEDAELDEKVLHSLYHIWRAVDQRQYLKAEEAYFRVTIGNDPWHLGIFGGGIHARTSLDKIQRGTLKRLMNSETVKNYMYAVRHLMSEAKLVFPPSSIAV